MASSENRLYVSVNLTTRRYDWSSAKLIASFASASPEQVAAFVDAPEDVEHPRQIINRIFKLEKSVLPRGRPDPSLRILPPLFSCDTGAAPCKRGAESQLPPGRGRGQQRAILRRVEFSLNPASECTR
jgi:hypothetical protein